MSAYRQDDRKCPRCESSLHDHEGHLVCDACHGMLIGVEDFAASFHELDGHVEHIEVREPTPESVTCPRCSVAMRLVTLQRGAHLLPGRFLHCVEHGVWVPRETMVSSYARATRRDPGVPGARSGRGNAMLDIAPAGTAAGAMRGIRGAFQVSTPMIGQYELPRPIVHTVFVSAFRGHRLACPTCAETQLGFEGDRWNCKACAGTFVEDAALVAMISDITHRPWDLPPAAGTPGARKCPVCAHAMTVEQFESVTVDRCAGHGQWFDDKELQDALLHAGDPPSNMGGWLKRLFHRS